MSGISAGAFPDRFLREDGKRTATANERVVMTLLSRGGPASRADLARLTGLAPHSITRLVEPLLERRLLAEAAPLAAGRGKPSVKLSLVAGAGFAVGLSVMTDAVSLVLLDLAGGVGATSTARLDSVEIQSATIQIGAMIAEAVAATGWDPAKMVGIGIGVTGYFIGEGGRLNPPSLLDPWALVPLDTILSAAFDSKVWIDNDGNVAAVGEAMLGEGRRVDDFAYLYFSAGFGGGVISSGNPLRGHNGNAGEFASILPNDWPALNLESLRRHLAGHGQPYPDLLTMLATFDPGDAAVGAWLDACAPSLDLVVSAISATLDPELIVLGGRLPSALAERIIDRVQFTNPDRRGYRRPVPQVVASSIRHDAAALGAAMLPLRAAFFVDPTEPG